MSGAMTETFDLYANGVVWHVLFHPGNQVIYRDKLYLSKATASRALKRMDDESKKECRKRTGYEIKTIRSLEFWRERYHDGYEPLNKPQSTPGTQSKTTEDDSGA